MVVLIVVAHKAMFYHSRRKNASPRVHSLKTERGCPKGAGVYQARPKVNKALYDTVQSQHVEMV